MSKKDALAAEARSVLCNRSRATPFPVNRGIVIQLVFDILSHFIFKSLIFIFLGFCFIEIKKTQKMTGMDKEKIEKVKKILSKWNPLGENAAKIKDLNDYETEAVDILFLIDDDFSFSRNKKDEERTTIIVKEILNEAFNLYLTNEDCKLHAIEINKVVKQ